jgi:chemotaxis regulatin CheY-phosphate phosphatase CheZ
MKERDYAQARTHFSRALKILEESFGSENLTIIAPAMLLADTLIQEGDFGQARALYWRALATSVKELGLDHHMTHISCNHFFECYSREDRDFRETVAWRLMMDSITTALVAAATAGATAGLTDTAKVAVGEAYAGLKALIKERFGVDNAVTEAVERLESKPDSRSRKLEVVEAVTESKAAESTEIVVAAEMLLAKLNETPAGEQHIQAAFGSYIAQADNGSTATVFVTRSE